MTSVLSKTDFARERGLFYTTGRQDAANVMDPNEIEEDVGRKPTASQIVDWLKKEGWSLEDFREQFDIAELGVTTEQARELMAAWRQGWADYASARMKAYAEEEDAREGVRAEYRMGQAARSKP